MGITANGLIHLGFIPEVDFSLEDKADGKGAYVARWLSLDPQPTVTEIEVADIEWQETYNSQEYSRSRKAEYPSIQECIHAILDDDLTALQVKRQAVKDKYPKGSN